MWGGGGICEIHYAMLWRLARRNASLCDFLASQIAHLKWLPTVYCTGTARTCTCAVQHLCGGRETRTAWHCCGGADVPLFCLFLLHDMALITSPSTAFPLSLSLPSLPLPSTRPRTCFTSSCLKLISNFPPRTGLHPFSTAACPTSDSGTHLSQPPSCSTCD